MTDALFSDSKKAAHSKWFSKKRNYTVDEINRKYLVDEFLINKDFETLGRKKTVFDESKVVQSHHLQNLKLPGSTKTIIKDNISSKGKRLVGEYKDKIRSFSRRRTVFF